MCHVVCVGTICGFSVIKKDFVFRFWPLNDIVVITNYCINNTLINDLPGENVKLLSRYPAVK